MTPGQSLDIGVLLSPYGLAVQDLYVFLAAIGAFFTVMTVGRVFLLRNSFAPRLKLLQERRQALREEMTAPRRRKHQKEETVAFMRRVVKKLKLIQQSQVGEVNNYLISSGIRNKDAIYVLMFFNFVTPFLFFGLSWFFVSFEPDMPKWHYAIPLFGMYIGMKLPKYIVHRKRKKRYIRIQRGLADTLDLLMICAEAGLSLAQGLERVGRELQNAYPEIADELALTSIELSFQPDRQKTLGALAQRVQLPEIKGIVNVLIQTEKYGTPIAQALRTLGQEFRTQRMLRAEQKAARLPAIMTVPMIVFILPTLFIIVIAPAAINLMNTPGP